jgi:hypothetical protein
MDEFTQHIKTWVHYDNEIHKLNKTLRELRLQKYETQTLLLANPTHDNINISDGRLRFSQTTVSQPLSLQFVTSCLSDLIRDPEQVTQLMEHIKDKRNKKTELTIKRFYNK